MDEELDGEKAAIVGGSAVPEVELEVDLEGSPSLAAGGFVIEVIQGVSLIHQPKLPQSRRPLSTRTKGGHQQLPVASYCKPALLSVSPGVYAVSCTRAGEADLSVSVNINLNKSWSS